MDKIEKLEELKETWKAAEKLSKKRGDMRYEMYSKGRVESLNSAIEIFKESDACECPQGSICEFFDKNELCQYGKI